MEIVFLQPGESFYLGWYKETPKCGSSPRPNPVGPWALAIEDDARAEWLVTKPSQHLWLAGTQFPKPCEQAENHTIATPAHKWKRIFAASADTRKKPFAHHSGSPVQANLHVLLGEVERCGCLRSAQFFNVPQHDHGAVLVRKVEHCFFQKLTEFADGGSLFRIKRRFDNPHTALFVVLSIFQLLVAIAPAHAPQCFMDCNACQPARERRVSGKLIKVLICPASQGARSFDDSWQKLLNAIHTKSRTLQEVG